MKKLLFYVLLIFTVCCMVGCEKTTSNTHRIIMKDAKWLYEELPTSATEGDSITVKVAKAYDLGFVFTVNGEKVPEDVEIDSAEFWAFTFAMPDGDAVIRFRTYDGFLPHVNYGTLSEAYLLNNPDIDTAGVREYYGEYGSGAIVAVMDGQGHTANEWSEEVAGRIFKYGDGNFLTVLYDGNFYKLPNAYSKGYLTDDDIEKIYAKYIEAHSEMYSRNFEAQYIRTDGYNEDVHYPVVKIIRSAEELNTYYLANKNRYDLERRAGTIYSDSTVGFLDACDRYGEEYFEDRILLLILLEEGSGSIRHSVEYISNNDNKLEVGIKTIVPEVGTDDMAEWHIFIEPEAGIDVTSEENITVFINGKNATEKLVPIYYSKGSANISLTLPEGWEYSITDETDVPDFSVCIYRSGQSDNCLRIGYYGLFGVCGTGLKLEKINIGNHAANMGTYDNNKVWNFISITDALGDYAIINECSEEWWSEYGDIAMKIFSTLKVGNGYATKSEAIKIAAEKADSDGKNAKVNFNVRENVWEVTLSGKNTNGEDTFIIDIHGNIVSIIE